MLKNLKLNFKLILIFLLIGLIPMGTVGIISLNKAKTALNDKAFNQLISLRDVKSTQISNYFGERMGDVTVLSTNPTVVEAMQRYAETFSSGGALSSEYRQVDKQFSPWLTQYEKEYGYYDLFLISPDGDIVYTVEKEPDFATNLVRGRFSSENIADLFKKARNETAMVDFDHYAPSNGTAASFVGAPVKDENGQFVGVVALQLAIGQINKIMQDRSGLGESGETYLVGSDLYMRSDSRFSDQSTILAQKIDTKTAKAAANGETGAEIVKDYRGINVLSAYAPIDILGMRWGILAEIDESEAFAATHALQNAIMIIALLMGVVIVAVGWFFARSISQPISNVANIAEQIATGDINQNVTYESGDEIGQLANSFRSLVTYMQEMAGAATKVAEGDLTVAINAKSHRDVLGTAFARMTGNLEQIVRELTDNATQLVSAATEISSSSEQMAAGANDQTQQAAQVATAIEEMTATIMESTKNASEASELAKAASDNANQGNNVVADTINSMQ
ncbi:MAG: HAMP domain-containing protein, partial [candidate division Zixibacteria bacterium]|nr:HAMP domain-containing protein [candidate division Zixibacteria bacterium]